jgi:radical SAM superfamily enzyme YgiQ (UPF0313 family)
VQFRRKRRIGKGNFQNLRHFSDLLNPFTKLGYVFWSHKALRWLTPFLIALAYVAAAWGRTVWFKPVEHVVEDIRRHGKKRIIFVDLNLISSRNYALELFHALTPLGVKWFGLSTTRITSDPELLDACARSGCTGLLMGLESMDPKALSSMQKGFNRPDDFAGVVEALHTKGIALQGCFVFGVDGESEEVFERTAAFAIEAGVDLPRYAISTPFPGTPLYQRLQQEGRLLYDAWWMDEAYRYNEIPFTPKGMDRETLETGCLNARKRFYSWPSIAKRFANHPILRRGGRMAFNYWLINAMHQKDTVGRSGMPLGDRNDTRPLLEVDT